MSAADRGEGVCGTQFSLLGHCPVILCLLLVGMGIHFLSRAQVSAFARGEAGCALSSICRWVAHFVA